VRRVITAGLAFAISICAVGAGSPAALAADAATLPFRAGAARVDIRVPRGAPLAGYGGARRRLIVPDVLGLYPHAFWFKPSESTLDPLAARALVMYAGETRVTWVAADLVAVTQQFVRRLGDRLTANGIRAGTLLVSASHTHSGPGGYLAGPVFAVTATDREAPEVRDAVLEAMVEAVRRAGAGARDARLAVGRAEAPADMTRGRLATEPDPTVMVLVLRGVQGEPIAIVWNYAIHPTMLGPRNRKLSGDVTGAVSRALEGMLGVPAALYVNGAVGDVSPQRHGYEHLEKTAEALVRTVRGAVASARPAAAAPMVVRVARIPLPSPGLSLKHCVSRWFPSWMRLPLGAWLPDTTDMVGVAIGRVAWVTMPGEAVSALGREIRNGAGSRWESAFVAGVSNDYLGYFVRPEDDDHVGYVTCAAVYGPRIGRCLSATASELLRRLPEAGPMTTGASPACDRP
jgi:neutral ceramidase